MPQPMAQPIYLIADDVLDAQFTILQHSLQTISRGNITVDGQVIPHPFLLSLECPGPFIIIGIIPEPNLEYIPPHQPPKVVKFPLYQETDWGEHIANFSILPRCARCGQQDRHAGTPACGHCKAVAHLVRHWEAWEETGGFLAIGKDAIALLKNHPAN